MASARVISPWIVSLASLLISLIQASQEDYDRFVQRWPLEHDLSCIHTDVKELGTDPIAKLGEPNWEGKRTYCFFVQDIMSGVYIKEWPSGDTLASAFVKKPSGINITTEGEPIEGCETVSDIDKEGPAWLKSPDFRVILRSLRKHCFYKSESFNSGDEFKTMVKVTYNSRTGLFKPRVVHFVIANDPSFYIVDDEDDINEVCTRCDAGGSFSQAYTITGSNLTSFLEAVRTRISGLVKSTVRQGISLAETESRKTKTVT